MEEIIIGIDIGGTTVKIGFLKRNGDILYKWEIPTNKENHGMIVEEIWQSIQTHMKKQGITIEHIASIGVGVPGFVDRESGLVYKGTNIGWENYELKKQLTSLADVPVFVENDANMAALGENFKGSGNQASNLIFVTLGTGVGGGIIVNGNIMSGENGTAGEIGHITIEPDGYACNCGQQGCLETIASATGMVRQAMEKISENPTSELAQIYHQHGDITTKEIFELASVGDTFCKQIIARTTDILGAVLADLAVIINPSQIIIGGGLSKAGEPLLTPIKYSFQKHALSRVSDVCEIKVAALGNDAGIIGACHFQG